MLKVAENTALAGKQGFIIEYGGGHNKEDRGNSP